MQTDPTRNRPSIPVTYLILAFGITWLCWIPSLIIAKQQGYVLPTLANVSLFLDAGFTNAEHGLVSILFSLAVYGPLTAAVVVTAREKGKAGLVDLAARVTKWRVPAKWYGLLFGIALLLPLVPRLIGEVTGLVQPGGPAGAWTLPFLAGLFFWQVLTSGLGEEPGWRGYLLPYLQARHGGDKSVWLLGIIWAVWHYPFTIYDTVTKMVDVPLAGMVVTIGLALLGQTMALVGITYLYTWLYNHTRSVFLAILFHALSNFLPAVLLAGVSPSLGILAAVMPWLVAFALEKIYGKEQFPGHGLQPIGLPPAGDA